MTPGTVVATTHGPVAARAVNQTPSCTHQNVLSAVTSITGSGEFVAYDSPFAPSPFANFGVPSCVASSLASASFTGAACGKALAMAASVGCGVPGLETRTFAFWRSGGIFANAGGNGLPCPCAHGPCSSDGPRNQRPE